MGWLDRFKKKKWDETWLKSVRDYYGLSNVSNVYKQHQTVHMAINAIANCAAQVEFKLFNGKGGDGKEIKNHRFLSLLENPNPALNQYQLWEATLIYYSLRGNCFWVMDESLGQVAGTSKIPAMIWPIGPDGVKPILDGKELMGYSINNNRVPIDRVIHFKKFNPDNMYMGFDPIEPIKEIVNLDYKAMLYNKMFFDNSAMPGGFLSTDSKLTNDQYNRIKEQFEKNHMGIQNARKLGILEGGLKYQSGVESHRDMEFLEQRRYNTQEILGMWRVPKSMFSITDDLNYATAQSQRKLFWENTIIPVLRYIEDAINSYAQNRLKEEIYGQFDLSNVSALMADYKEKVATAEALFRMGFTANEINERLDLGFDNKDWRDKWWIPFGQAPADEMNFDHFIDEPEKSMPNQSINKIEDLLIKEEKSEQRQRDDAYWYQFNNSVKSIEFAMNRAMKRYFFELRKELLGSLEETKSKGIGEYRGFNWGRFNDRLKEISIKYLADAAKTGVANASNKLGLNIDFSIFNHKIASMISGRVTKLKRINETIKNEVDSAINAVNQEALEEGLSIQEVANRIKDRTKNTMNLANKRAITIARTEVLSVTNGGQYLTYKEAGITKHRWISARDGKVRDSHAGLDGQIVDIGKKFSNGLTMPHDNSGPADEVINCRCTTVAADFN